MAHNDKSLPLALRKDLRDNEANLTKNLGRIAAVTGGAPWTFETNYDAVNKVIDSSYQNRLGEILYGSYLDELASKIEKICQDDMVKEAFVDKVTAHKIVFEIAETDSYQEIKLGNDGVLYIRNKPTNFWCNISNLGDDIEKQL